METGSYDAYENQDNDDYDMDLYNDGEIFQEDDASSRVDNFELPLKSDGSELVDVDQDTVGEEDQTDFVYRNIRPVTSAEVQVIRN